MNKDMEEFIERNTDMVLVNRRGGEDPTYVIYPDDLRAWMQGHVRVPVETIQNMLKSIRDELDKSYSEAEPVCCGSSGHECCGSPEPEWPPHAMAIMDALGPIEKELSVMLNASKGGGV